MQSAHVDQDWVANIGSYVLVWGIPAAAMIVAIWLPHPTKRLVWLAALLWMGLACVVNAKRCGRMHCYFTGPFFLLMTVPVGLHGFDIVSLGSEGWKWLGLTIGFGASVLWSSSERLWGRYWS